MSEEVKLQLDDVIEELIHLEIEKNGNVVPDLNELSPEELEEIKLFEMFVRDVMDNKLAMA
jgi:hypothetical protein